MVRLKDISSTVIRCANKFQFQYGAIEGHDLDAEKVSVILFQFQYGAIEGISRIVHVMSPFSFQFQYGAIEGKTGLKAALKYGISIPVWCD